MSFNTLLNRHSGSFNINMQEYVKWSSVTDDDSMLSASNINIPSGESIKAYVDTQDALNVYTSGNNIDISNNVISTTDNLIINNIDASGINIDTSLQFTGDTVTINNIYDNLTTTNDTSLLTSNAIKSYVDTQDSQYIPLTSIIDDDSFATVSASTLASSESIKAYINSFFLSLTTEKIPIGTLIYSACNNETAMNLEGYALCNHSEVSKIIFDKLWTAFGGHLYGTPSDPTNNFLLPDIQYRAFSSTGSTTTSPVINTPLNLCIGNVVNNGFVYDNTSVTIPNDGRSYKVVVSIDLVVWYASPNEINTTLYLYDDGVIVPGSFMYMLENSNAYISTAYSDVLLVGDGSVLTVQASYISNVAQFNGVSIHISPMSHQPNTTNEYVFIKAMWSALTIIYLATKPMNVVDNVVYLSYDDTMTIDVSGNLILNYTGGNNINVDASSGIISTTDQFYVDIGDFYLRNTNPSFYAKFVEPFSQFTSARSIEIQDSSGVLALTSDIDNAVAKIFPIGSIINYSSTTPPANWFICDGQILDNTLYPELFAIIGYNFGGSGLNFSIPDCGGLFVRGWDYSAGGYDPDAPRAIGTIQTDAMQSHIHTVDIYDKTMNYTIGSEPLDFRTDTGTIITTTSTPSTGKTNTDETRPVNICLPFIIRYI